ncbi:MAG: hypothetical protein WCA09_02745 [Burkholderiales bacterium]
MDVAVNTDTMRLLRSVAIEEWVLADFLAEGRPDLIRGLEPGQLLDAVAQDADRAASRDEVKLEWQESYDSPGHYRLVAQIPLTPTVFDQLFNGRSGYRAQFYLSPEEGVLYNRDLLDRLCRPVEVSFYRRPLPTDLGLVLQSLRAPHAKLWVYREKAAFDEAAADTLNPPRWVANGATRGRRAPLPSHATIDVKGAFLQLQTGNLFVDPLKLDRPMDLFNRGYT